MNDFKAKQKINGLEMRVRQLQAQNKGLEEQLENDAKRKKIHSLKKIIMDKDEEIQLLRERVINLQEEMKSMVVAKTSESASEIKLND